MLHYHVSGEAHHPSLLFLHGFLGDLHDWDPVVDVMKSHARCLCIDLPGHGLSSNVRATSFDDAADGIAEVLAHAEAPSVSAVGYSMGGRIALHTVLRHPKLFRGLMLESASAGIAHEGERRVRRSRDLQMAAELEDMELSAFLRWWYSQPMFASLAKRPDLLGSLLVRRGMQQPKELAAALRVFSPGIQPSLWGRLCEIHVPTFLLAGEDDPKYVLVAKSMLDTLLNHSGVDPGPRATSGAAESRHRLRIVPGCGHNLHLENPDAYCDELLDFLRVTG